ncbi:MAG: hypothetical protein ACM3UU_05725 [Ignavibacteriales bacterium]
MIFESQEYKKILKKFVIILISFICVLFTAIAITIYFMIPDRQVFWVFMIVASVFDITWALVYKFYVSKI